MHEHNHPADVHVPAPEHSSRWLALMTLLFLIPKIIILIPHLVVLWFLRIAGFIVAIAAQVAVLFTGKYPEAMHEFVVGVMRWQVRVVSYLAGLRDEYPPFTLKK